ncbi:MAG: sulfur transferase domain-containing protein [Granulosicoccus sp.]
MKRRTLIATTATLFSLGATRTVWSQTAKQLSLESRSVPFNNYGRRIQNAPFGEEITKINNYNRTSPYIANAGLLQEGGLEELKALGFKLVVDLRGKDEKGVSEEVQLANEIGIPYTNIPVVDRAPTWGQVDALMALIHDKKNYPMIIHCVSSNRSGAIWAMYRYRVGVDALTAIEEGRAAGLESRESAVRKALKLD